ncbi:MAG: F0F1 ATP synthase subunit epsilon [Dehalococcoidales bacterium]|nr:F0F1 ATP synthase subunit epsilon [Dehalococcoidales bacterium]
MASFKLDIVTAEKVVFSEDVDMIVAPGLMGELGILPHHTPLMTTLLPGELRIRKGDDETVLAISGGFLEVRPTRVIVLADAAERADEIDVARAEAARQKAQDRLAHHPAAVDEEAAQAALARAVARLKIAEKVKRRRRNL